MSRGHRGDHHAIRIVDLRDQAILVAADVPVSSATASCACKHVFGPRSETLRFCKKLLCFGHRCYVTLVLETILRAKQPCQGSLGGNREPGSRYASQQCQRRVMIVARGLAAGQVNTQRVRVGDGSMHAEDGESRCVPLVRSLQNAPASQNQASPNLRIVICLSWIYTLRLTCSSHGANSEAVVRRSRCDLA